ncbi:MAG: flippase-like domain-containing protein [Gammaproteobacteria bacterium]|nr:flippase-like domain-containing protein [Gammaproteobacteria bacterium]
MKTKHPIKYFLVIFGTLFSIILLAIIATRLDWNAFFLALKNINVWELLPAAFAIALSIVLRSLRWNLISGMPVSKIKYFWEAASIGYLGNIIYPARAGEILRIMAIYHFLSLGLGRAAVSSLFDRILDVVVLGVFMLLVILIHGGGVFGFGLKVFVIGLLIAAVLAFIIVVIYGEQWQKRLKQREIPENAKMQHRLRSLILHILEGVQVFQHSSHMALITALTFLAFTLDCYILQQVMGAFGWSLPWEAVITVAVFVALGISLPSAPGYVGVYQIACVLALALYDVPEASAVAFSLVVQLTGWIIIGGQGVLVSIYCGFNFSRVNREEMEEKLEEV